MKENSGFTHMECIALRAEFSKYTLSNCDAILYGGFEKLVVKVIPHMKDNIKMNKNLQKWSQDPHVSQNNRIEFKGFLWILRRLVDKDNKESMIRAKFLRQELGYDKKQVQDLRELFKITDTDLSGSVDVSELSVLFSGLVDMSGDAHKDLMRFVEELDSNDEEALDFFDFLRLMKKLEDRNWRNISRLADHQVETGEAPLEESMLMYKGKSAMMSKGSGHEFML
jgi:Ca2+-binding EF-hand superfamily protein